MTFAPSVWCFGVGFVGIPGPRGAADGGVAPGGTAGGIVFGVPGAGVPGAGVPGAGAAVDAFAACPEPPWTVPAEPSALLPPPTWAVPTDPSALLPPSPTVFVPPNPTANGPCPSAVERVDENGDAVNELT